MNTQVPLIPCAAKLCIIIAVATIPACAAIDPAHDPAAKYELAKAHFLLDEWIIHCAQPTDLTLYASGCRVEESFIHGVTLPSGSHVMWVQRDLTQLDRLLFQFPPTTTIEYPNVFGGAYKIVLTEGDIQGTGSWPLLRSNDGKTTIFLKLAPADPNSHN